MATFSRRITPSSRSLTLLGLGLTLMCLSSNTLAKDFYKWQDADGVTHYSSQPSKEYKSVKVRASNIRDAETTADSLPASPDTKEETASTASARPEQSKDPERCATAQQNRKTLAENSRVRIQDGEEYRYLTPEEIQQQIDLAEQTIADEC